jgi:hypothetical protein
VTKQEFDSLMYDINEVIEPVFIPPIPVCDQHIIQINELQTQNFKHHQQCHFYVSYHGHNACDVITSPAKLKINTQLLSGTPI